MDMNVTENRIQELERQLEEAKREIRNLNVSVRAERLKVQISSEYSSFALWEYDIADDVCYQYKKLSGRYESNLDPIVHFRETVISWGSVYADDIPEFHRLCDAMQRGDKELRYDIRCINDDCDLVWFRYEGKTVYSDSGKPLRVIGRTLDVTAEKGSVGTVSDERHDPLTGAMTLSAFKDDVMQKLVSGSRIKNSALMVLGIDGFSTIKEKLGLEYADYVQKTFGKVLNNYSACEQGSAFARVKNGVFAFFVRFSVLPNLNAIATRLVFAFQNYPFQNGGHFTLSLGISIFKGGKDYDTVYNEAYMALRAARAKGGNGYLHYSPVMANEIGLNVSGDAGRISAEVDSSAVMGAHKVYREIIRAMTHDSSAPVHMAAAFREACKFSNSSRVVIFITDGRTYMPYSADGKSYDSTLPCVEAYGSAEETADALSNNDIFYLSSSLEGGTFGGFRLTNGASNAACCPVTDGEKLVGYFAFVSDSPISWQTSDENVFLVLAEALCSLYRVYNGGRSENRRKSFEATIIGNLNIEGFSIDPETYAVDYVGANASRRYGLKPGDICYKKVRGTDHPCSECPTLLLNDGEMLASCASYRESDERWLDITASVEQNEDGKKRYFISNFDITDCMGKIKTRDALTGMMNFDMFTMEATRRLSKGVSDNFLVVINVAKFRRLNEEHGFECGNTVLIAIADILSASVGEKELLCRADGARYLAMLRNSGMNELQKRLNQLLASVQKQVFERCGLQIYLVVGVYDMGEENIGIMGALDRALTAQKIVKNKAYYTENLISVYDTALKNELYSRRHIEAHMLEALENDEFKVYYQPKVNVADGRVVGAEALVRWIRPDGEIISPGRFVPLFEENGFITDMDFAIYRHVAEDVRKWLGMGIEIPLISLNVSRQHIKDEGFTEKFNSLMDGLSVPHDRIELEITESMLTENLNKLIEVITQLKSSGFSISVDDFGSGYSSLNLITLLPFDTLKIDGGFFLKNELTEKNKAVIASVVKLAKNLHLETVSEGVETGEQVEFLRELGCDMIQGYYYYKPMPSEDFEKLIAEQNVPNTGCR